MLRGSPVADGHSKQRELELYALRDMMKTEAGRASWYRILESTGVFVNVFSSDANTHAYAAGKQAVGYWLIDELKQAAPSSFHMMMKENDNE